MKVHSTRLAGVLIIEPSIFSDKRGHFLEIYQAKRYSQHGITKPFVQDNISFSTKGVLRGLHYQLKYPQAKLVMVAEGAIYDVAVDIRRGSPTFGRWVGIRLTSHDRTQIYIPEGFAHGFCVIGDRATVIYKCTDYYYPEDERGIIWNDPCLAIRWPIDNPVVSEKDASYPSLDKISEKDLPIFER